MKNKKILIVTYWFPPLEGIATLRPFSWAQEFSIDNEITVLTINPNITEFKSEVIHSENSRYKVLTLPFKNPRNTKFTHLYQNIRGNLDYSKNAYSIFFPFLSEHLKDNKYDIAIGTCNPIDIAKCLSKIYKKFKLKYILDFRDFWFLNLHKKDLSSFEKLKHNYFYHFFIKKWIKTVVFSSTVSEYITDYFVNFNTKSYTIYNGFFKDEVNNLSAVKNDTFTLSCIGQIYSHQNLYILLNGIDLFYTPEKKVKINFIGLPLKEHKRIKFKLLKNVTVSDRIEKNKSDKIKNNSDILFFVGWNGYKGIYSGKIFEYLGAKKNILIAPSDEDVIEKLLKETNAGEVANTPEEVCAYLERKYTEWESNGFLEYKGIDEKINFYTRENQAKILMNKIEETLEWK